MKAIDKRLTKEIPKNTNDFVQITRGYLSETRELARKSMPAYELLMFLVERMDRSNSVLVSQTALCELLKYSRTSIQTAVKILTSENWIQAVKIGSVNAYTVNSKVFWRSINGKRYASFYAEVIATETEQVETIEEMDEKELKIIPSVKKNENIISADENLPPPDQKELLEHDYSVIPLTKKK